LLVLLTGFCVGVISGMVGIGGGVLVIPVLMIGFGFSQARANGTSLAMLLPPIGIFAVIAYARAGNIDWRYAGLLAAGFAAGAYVGARAVNAGLINPTALRICFALVLVYCAGRILFRPGGRARSAAEALLLAIGFALAYAVMRLLGRRLKASPSYWGMVYRQRQREPFEHDFEI
jgi:uncharacterized membrane protein YfcA